jgi:hypothetical protein
MSAAMQRCFDKAMAAVADKHVKDIIMRSLKNTYDIGEAAGWAAGYDAGHEDGVEDASPPSP